MRYPNTCEARLLQRLNRFAALVELDGKVEEVHVKNTGRCAELMVPGARVDLVKCASPARKTAYDLVAVEKNGRLINMDSMAPNLAAREWLEDGWLGRLDALRPEVTVGNSRFDFCAVQDGRPVAIEVKGCTLEVDGVARFPDAPTLRGLKHVRGLTALAGQGWRCVVLIVIQMKGVRLFAPNWQTHPAFGHALRDARAAGVEIRAVDCLVQHGEVRIDAPVPVDLNPPEG